MGTTPLTCKYCGLEVIEYIGAHGTRLWVTEVRVAGDWERHIYCPASPELGAQRHMIGDHEMQLRARFQELASQPALLGMWRDGTCTGCGMDDEPVKGPPGAELCRYCDELKGLPPLNGPPPVPRPPDVMVIRRGRSPVPSIALMVCSWVLLAMPGYWQFLGLAFFALAAMA